MEQAKQAASYVTEFIQGNPMATPAGVRVERATESGMPAENWELNMELCDIVNYSEEGARDTVRAIRKRLQAQMAGKEQQSVLYALTLLETCVKNGNHRFHQMVMEEGYVRALVALIGPKHDPPQAVQERVLGLIQSWSDAFRGDPALAGVCTVYDELRSKGVEFPATDLDSMAPILTPKRTVAPADGGGGGEQAGQAPTVAAVRPPVSATPEQLAKLRSELDVVSGNAKVLREMMSELTPGAESADELELMGELHGTLKEMQTRIVALFHRVATEEVTNELLLINDELNNVFDKYERYSKNQRTASGANLSSAAAAANEERPKAADQTGSSASPAKGKPPAASAAKEESGNGEPSLIDLGGDGGDLSQQMQSLDVATGATGAQPSSTAAEQKET